MVTVLLHQCTIFVCFPAIWQAAFFIHKYKTSFSSPEMLLKGQRCWGTYQDGANMASKWRIDNVFLDMGIEKRRQKGTKGNNESWTSGWPLLCGYTMLKVTLTKFLTFLTFLTFLIVGCSGRNERRPHDNLRSLNITLSALQHS